MANPMYNLLSSMVAQKLGGVNPMGMTNPGQTLQENTNDMQAQFNNFKRTVQGDPKAMVEQLRASGQMSNQQFEMLSAMAKALSGKLT